MRLYKKVFGPIEHSQPVAFEEVRTMLDLLLILLPYLLSMTLISPVKTTALVDVQDGDHPPSHPQDGNHPLVKIEKVAGVEDGDQQPAPPGLRPPAQTAPGLPSQPAPLPHLLPLVQPLTHDRRHPQPLLSNRGQPTMEICPHQ